MRERRKPNWLPDYFSYKKRENAELKSMRYTANRGADITSRLEANGIQVRSTNVH